MITLKCSTPDTVLLTAMTPFQGELKKRTDQDINDLAESLIKDGLIMPFALWQQPETDVLYVLDGHGRMQALVHIALTDASVLKQEFPAIIIQAANEDEARKFLLQITSTYGRFNKVAVLDFATKIIDYKAPVLVKAVKPVPVQKAQKPAEDRAIVRVSCPKEKVKQLTTLLKQVDGLEIF